MDAAQARAALADRQPPDPRAFWLGDWRVTPATGELLRGAERCHLEPRVMDVLCMLSRLAPETVSAEQLLEGVWRGTFYGDNPVHKSIAHLRRALGDSATDPKYLATVRKRGYRIVTRVHPVEHDLESAAPQRQGWSDGSPFRGLRAFEERHATLFFGRDAAIGRVTAALGRQLQAGSGFVLLLGPSGSGKTSLLRAGVVPLLCAEHGFDGLRIHDASRLDASGAGSDAIAAMADAMLRWTIRGRPVFLPGEQQSLRSDLTEAPQRVVERLQHAQMRAAANGQASASLLLIIDQTEALVAGSLHDTETLAKLGRALQCLTSSGCVMVLVACRSDFYPALLRRLPAVLALKGEHGHVDLAPMADGELARCIRGPAAEAGLSFEVDPSSQLRLDDCLRDDAIRQPQSLPLLQHALDALYARRTPDGCLTFAAYRELGGLGGAIASQANQVFDALDSGTRAALPELLGLLVSLHPTDDELVARQVPLDAVRSDAGLMLVEAFIDARLFVSVLEQGGRRFGVAHEALLRHWPRVGEWVEENRQRLRAHAQVADATRRWKAESRRDDVLLQSERQLAEGRELLRMAPGMLSVDERRFLQRSLLLGGRRRRARMAARIVFLVVAAVAAGMGVRASLAAAEAERRRQEAEAMVDYLLGDLADRLRPLGRLDVLGSVAERALQSLQQRQPGSTSPTASFQRSRALATLGEVLLEQGDADSAARAFEESASLVDSLLRRNADDTDLLESAGNIAFWRGAIAYRDNRLAEAESHWQRYAGYSGRMLQLRPDAPKAWLEQSYALNNLGTVASDRGDLDAALPLFEQSLQFKQRYLDANPGDAALQADLADTLSWLGTALEQSGRLQDAARLHRRELAMLESLAAEDPRDAPLSHRLALSRMRSGMLQLSLGNAELARQLQQLALQQLQSLHATDPSNRGWHRDLAFAHLQKGEMLEALGAPAAAATAYRQSAAVMDTLLDAGNSLPDWQRIHALAQLRLAVMTAGSADPGTALAEIEQARAQLHGLWQLAPDDRDARRALARAHLALGDVQHAAGEDRAAAESWIAAERLLSEYRESRDHHLLDPLLASLVRLQRHGEAEQVRQRLASTGFRTDLFSFDAPPTTTGVHP